MYKKHRALKEIWLFIRRHIIICVLCVVCVFIITKYSQIPMPDWFPEFFHNLFLCPSADTALYEWLSLLNNLSLAFLASIIVYIVVQYIPERRKANKAFSLLRKEFVSLYSYMSAMICMYLYELGITVSEKEITLDQLSGICKVEMTDEVRKCKIRHLRNGKFDNCNSVGYALYRDSLDSYKRVKESIGKIKGTLCSANLDISILDTLSKLENNRFLSFFSHDNPLIKKVGFNNYIVDFDKGFFEFIECHLSLGKFSFDKIYYDYSLLTDEEYREEREESLFMKPRGIYLVIDQTAVEKFTTTIISLEPTELRLRKSAGVLLEMLVYYDKEYPKPDYILFAANEIAEYIFNNETDSEDAIIAFLNLAQIKKRLGKLNPSDFDKLRQIESDINSSREAVVGSAILCEDFEKANDGFSLFTNEEKQVFIQLPIYHLWNNPPMEPNPNPMSFLVFEKDK